MATTRTESFQHGTTARRKVLITGVRKGLGRALELELELASRGHTIISCSREQTKLDSLRAELSKSSPNKHFFFNVDVVYMSRIHLSHITEVQEKRIENVLHFADSNDKVEKLAQAAVENKLVPDIIVNNAGLANRKGKIWELDVDDFDDVIDTNVKGIANILRHFIPLMIPNKQGIIVNMSSSAKGTPHEDFAPYCTSKCAVEGLSKSIAKGLLEGMTIITLDPGVQTCLFYTW